MRQTMGQRGSGAIPISPRTRLVAASTGLLDASCTRRDRVATSGAFDHSTRYELAFWQMAYTRGER
jgi:thiaminase